MFSKYTSKKKKNLISNHLKALATYFTVARDLTTSFDSQRLLYCAAADAKVILKVAGTGGGMKTEK